LQAGASFAPDGASELTLSAYVKSAAIGNDLSIIGTTAGTFDDNNLGIRYDSEGFLGGGTNALKFSVENKAGLSENGETESSSQTTNKQSMVLTWVSGAAPKLYTDGSESSYTSAPGTLSGVVSIPDLYVGRGLRDGSGLWEGIIDEVRLAATALTADRIATEYNNQSSPSTFYIASAPTVATPVNPSITNLLATSARLNWEQG
jgi:MSHA biogenesis protein MshQ